MINEGAGEATIVEGKTVDEAVRKGLILSGWTKEQVTVEVLDPGSHTPWVNAGLARVRLSRRTANAFQLASEVTAGILHQVGLEGRARVEQRPDHLHVMVEGEGLEEALVSGDGEGLDALQHVVSRIVSKRSGSRQLVSIDLGGFRERRERHLRDLAYQIADEVRQSGRKVLTEPMGAAERRVIHLALNEDPDITTFAIGEGLVKAITIAPIDQAPPPEERRPAGRFGGGRRDFERGRERGGRGDRGESGGRGGGYRGGERAREGGRGPGGREGGRSSGGGGRPSGPGGMGGRGPGGPGGGRGERRPGPGRERGGYPAGGRGPSAGGERGGQHPDARDRGRSGPPMGGGERSGQWERSGGVRDSRPPREGEDRDWRRPQEPRPRDEGWASESRESRLRPDYGDRGPRVGDPRVGDRDPRAGDPRAGDRVPRPGDRDPRPGDRDPRPGDRDPRPGDRDPRARDSRAGGRDPRGPERPKPGPSFLSDNESWDPIGDGEFIDDFSPDDPAMTPEDQPPTPPVDEQPRAERRPGRSWRGRGEGGRRR